MSNSLALVTFVATVCLSCGVAERVDEVVGPSREPRAVAALRSCPEFGSWLMLPRTPAVGEPAALQVHVTDADTPPERLAFQWRADSGSFTEPSSTQTSFICAQEGYQTLSLVARDDTDCARQLDIEINCFPR